MTEPKELLKHELADLLYAERRFLTATRTMARETSDPEVRARVQQHVGETEKHIERLEKAFESIGEKAKSMAAFLEAAAPKALKKLFAAAAG